VSVITLSAILAVNHAIEVMGLNAQLSGNNLPKVYSDIFPGMGELREYRLETG
jgi:hypothetical protein